jgi:ABC-type Mn2+/Zn2+ transport system permease subunit
MRHVRTRRAVAPIPQLCGAFLLALLLTCGGATAQTRSTAGPTDAVEKGTLDALRNIESGSDSPAAVPRPATRPTGIAVRARPVPSWEAGSGPRTWEGWLGLVKLFAPALITAVAVGIACAVSGVFVLLRREALLALALPQVVAVGAAVGMRLGWPTLPPAMAAAVAAVVYLAGTRRSGKAGWTLPALYVGGLCLSFLVIANHGQDVADLQNLFTGIDVAVSPIRAEVVTPILLGIALTVALLWRRWLLLAQAPAAAELAGLRLAKGNAMFLSLLVAVVLLGTDSLGVVMVLSMLFLPAATVLPWARRIPTALASASVLAVAFVGVGFYLSNAESWPLSQSVGGVGFATLVVSHVFAVLRDS